MGGEQKMVTAIREEILPQIPVGRLGKPEEVAGLIIYLASEEAAFVTGANIAINGGQHMQQESPDCRRTPAAVGAGAGPSTTALTHHLAVLPGPLGLVERLVRGFDELDG